jgi:type IV pilus assembly protein PilW
VIEEAQLFATPRHPPRAAGFSLIEILVGLGIGMIGIIVIMQVFSVSEGQRRTTSTGGDAQTAGAIALHTLSRNLRQGGYGIASFNLLGCTITLPNGTVVPAAPVTVNPAGIPAGDVNTDVIQVIYGNANAVIEGDLINQQPSAGVYAVRTPTNFVSGDFVVAEPETRPNPCNLSVAQVNAPPTATTVSVSAGEPLVVARGVLYNLGQTPQVLVYAVRSGNLTVCDFTQNNCAGGATDQTVWSPIAEGIASLRAEYGRDTRVPMTLNAIVDTWDQSTPVTACDWTRVSALRLALVARSGQYDKSTVTTTAPAWAGSATTPVNLTGNSDWQHYRYKTFQTVVPIRNMAWMGVQSGC